MSEVSQTFSSSSNEARGMKNLNRIEDELTQGGRRDIVPGKCGVDDTFKLHTWLLLIQQPLAHFCVCYHPAWIQFTLYRLQAEHDELPLHELNLFFITSQILSTRARAFTLHVVSSTVSTKLNTSALCLLRFVWMLEKCTFSELFHSHSRSSLSHAFPSSYFSRSVAVLFAVLARSSRFECYVEKGKAVLMLLWVMNSFKEFPYAVF